MACVRVHIEHATTQTEQQVVFARLVLDGEGDVGVHNFIVPLRDPDTHEPLPGIRIGDLVRVCVSVSVSWCVAYLYRCMRVHTWAGALHCTLGVVCASSCLRRRESDGLSHNTHAHHLSTRTYTHYKQGAKMGLNGIDNGWIQFDHVRVPHDHMLCRYAQVWTHTYHSVWGGGVRCCGRSTDREWMSMCPPLPHMPCRYAQVRVCVCVDM